MTYTLIQLAPGSYDLLLDGTIIGAVVRGGTKISPIWIAELLPEGLPTQRPDPFTEVEHEFTSFQELRRWLGKPSVRPLKASVSPIDPAVTLKPILGETVDAPTQGMRQAMEFAVPVNDEQFEELRLSNNLSVSPDYTSQIVSHFFESSIRTYSRRSFPSASSP